MTRKSCTLASLLLLLAAAPAAPALPPALAQEVARLTAGDAEAFDQFGVAVAIDGTTAVVGAFREDTLGGSAGAAYVFERDQGGPDQWGQVKKLLAADGGADDRFGFAVAIAGDTIVVGARGDNDLGFDSGSAYVFERDQGGPDQWGQVKKLLAADGGAEDELGYGVAIVGATVAVGARYEDGAATDAGAVYLFERDLGGAGNWGQLAKLAAADAAAADEFGYALALDGDTLAVGARGRNENDVVNTGAVYLFERDLGGADNWGQLIKLTAADAQAGDEYGRAVAVDGDRVAVGAPLADDAGLDAGAVYLYGRNQGGVGLWGEIAKIVAGDGAVEDQLGLAVALEGDLLAVGAPFDNGAASDLGAVYLFERNQGGINAWGQARKIVRPDAEGGDELGSALALAGDLLLVGAVLDDLPGAADAGSASIYGLPGPVVRLPRSTPAVAGQAVTVPVTLAGQGHALTDLAFSIDFDAACLDFDTTDVDVDGIPDALVLTTPASFDATVFVDLGDVDGEIDVNLSANQPNAFLADGEVARISFTACVPGGGTAFAPVLFSGDPAPAVIDDLGRGYAAGAADGVVEVSSVEPGDCNADGSLSVADAVACRLEIFDGDGAAWLDAFGGTFAGHPEGCDANADAVIDAGDVACKGRLLFGLACDPPPVIAPAATAGATAGATIAGKSAGPRLVATTVAVDARRAVVRLSFVPGDQPGDQPVTSVAFSLDLDPSRLAFDPNAVLFLGPGATLRSASFDATDPDGELDVLLADLAPSPRARPAGPLLELVLARRDASDLAGALRFATEPRASFGEAGGRSVAGTVEVAAPPFFADGFESGDLASWSQP